MKIKFVIILFCLLFSSCITRGQSNLVNKSIKVGDLDRTFLFFAPNQNKEKLPLVFVFHGGGGDGKGIAGLTKFANLAEKEKFIAVFPDGIGKSWNDGRETDAIAAQREKHDDLAFVKAIIEWLSKEFNIDEKRIFATGISNGGIFSHFLGANLADRFAAIAPVAGGIPKPFNQRFNPANPVSVLIIQGTADPLVLYDGGAVARNRGEIISTDEAIGLWKKTNRITSESIKGILPDIQPNDGCTVETYLWTNGKNNTEIKLLKQVGGGHTWAGGIQYAPKFFIGGVCRDFNATETIWEFFKTHPKP